MGRYGTKFKEYSIKFSWRNIIKYGKVVLFFKFFFLNGYLDTSFVLYIPMQTKILKIIKDSTSFLNNWIAFYGKKGGLSNSNS